MQQEHRLPENHKQNQDHLLRSYSVRGASFTPDARKSAAFEVIAEQPVAEVALTLKAVQQAEGSEIEREVARALVEFGFLRRLEISEYDSLRATAHRLPSLLEDQQQVQEQVSATQQEHAALNFKANSPLAAVWYRCTLRPWVISEARSDLVVINKRLEKHRAKLEAANAEVETAQRARAQSDPYTPTSIGALALSPSAEQLLRDFKRYPSTHRNRTFQESALIANDWRSLLRDWSSAYREPHVCSWAATRLTGVSQGDGVSLRDLLDCFQQAYAHAGVSSEAASRIAASSLISGNPLGPYFEAFDQAYRVSGLNSVSAAHLAVFAVENELPASRLIESWEKAWQLSGLDSISAALIATNAADLNLDSLLDKWRQAWSVSGLKSISAAQLAISSERNKVPIEKLIGAWEQAWQLSSCNSHASAYLAIASEIRGGDLKRLLLDWQAAYQQSGVSAVSAAQLAELSAAGLSSMVDLLNRFQEAYSISGVSSAAASSMVLQSISARSPNSPFSFQEGSSYSSRSSSSSYSGGDSGFNMGTAVLGDMLDDGSMNLSGGFLLGGLLG